jgi:hypothetical protein
MSDAWSDRQKQLDSAIQALTAQINELVSLKTGFETLRDELSGWQARLVAAANAQDFDKVSAVASDIGKKLQEGPPGSGGRAGN